jgi:transposase
MPNVPLPNDADATASCGSFAAPAVVEGGRRPTETTAGAANPELILRSRRRRVFSPAEKLRLLADVDAAAGSGSHGAIGVILRKEGLYASTLSTWRRQRESGLLCAKRGPKALGDTPALRAEIDRLQRENKTLQARLTHAETIIDLQKKVSNLLTIPPIDALPLREGRL